MKPEIKQHTRIFTQKRMRRRNSKIRKWGQIRFYRQTFRDAVVFVNDDNYATFCENSDENGVNVAHLSTPYVNKRSFPLYLHVTEHEINILTWSNVNTWLEFYSHGT